MVAPNHATLFLDFEQENPATYNLNKNKTLPKKRNGEKQYRENDKKEKEEKEQIKNKNRKDSLNWSSKKEPFELRRTRYAHD
jgi:hypothetical protein